MIICCGDALIDMLPVTLANGTDAYQPVLGGAVFNTAVALGKLGQSTGFFCGISTDMFGQQLVRTLSEAGVETGLAPRLGQPTTLAFVELVGGQAEYTFMDENSAGQMLDVHHLPELGGDVDALHFGAISLIPDPCGHAYETLIAEIAEKRGDIAGPQHSPRFHR